MKNLLDKSKDITITVKGQDHILISKAEVDAFIIKMSGAKFVSRSQASKITGMSYLGSVNASAKIVKGLKKGFSTYILYLAPYKGLFGNVCANGEHCYKPCLNTSGRVKMDVREFKILRARNFKTMLFYINREFFNKWLFAEISASSKLHDNFMVRLNGTSDLSPKLFQVDGVNVLEAFKDVLFYDYTKIPNRADLVRPNYHITFSFNGYNMDECLSMMDKGINVSIVIDGEMPETFKGVPVFDMDSTDLRPLDEAQGHFGYLKLKQTLNKSYDTKFIINL